MIEQDEARRPGRPRTYTAEDVLAAAERLRAGGRAINGDSLRREMGGGGRNALMTTLREAERERDMRDAVAATIVEALSPGAQAALESGMETLRGLLNRLLILVQAEIRSAAEEHVQSVRAELAAAQDQIRALEQGQDATDIETDRLRQTAEERGREAERLKARLLEAKARVDERDAARKRAEATASAAEQKTARLEGQLSAMETMLAEARAAQRAAEERAIRAEGARKRMVRTDQKASTPEHPPVLLNGAAGEA